MCYDDQHFMSPIFINGVAHYSSAIYALADPQMIFIHFIFIVYLEL